MEGLPAALDRLRGTQYRPIGCRTIVKELARKSCCVAHECRQAL